MNSCLKKLFERGVQYLSGFSVIGPSFVSDTDMLHWNGMEFNKILDLTLSRLLPFFFFFFAIRSKVKSFFDLL